MLTELLDCLKNNDPEDYRTNCSTDRSTTRGLDATTPSPGRTTIDRTRTSYVRTTLPAKGMDPFSMSVYAYIGVLDK